MDVLTEIADVLTEIADVVLALVSEADVLTEIAFNSESDYEDPGSQQIGGDGALNFQHMYSALAHGFRVQLLNGKTSKLRISFRS